MGERYNNKIVSLSSELGDPNSFCFHNFAPLPSNMFFLSLKPHYSMQLLVQLMEATIGGYQSTFRKAIFSKAGWLPQRLTEKSCTKSCIRLMVFRLITFLILPYYRFNNPNNPTTSQ